MPEIKGLENVYLVLAFVVPGLIMTFIRAQFLTGRVRAVSESVVPYLALSVLYYGLSFPFVERVLAIREPGPAKVFAWLGLIFVGPVVVGLALGIVARTNLFRRIVAKLGLSLVHPMPTAWDYAFANQATNAYVILTLSDGSTVAGMFGTNSFASSDPAERDILIEDICDVDGNGGWTRRAEQVAMLVTAKDIRHLQIWKTSGGQR